MPSHRNVYECSPDHSTNWDYLHWANNIHKCRDLGPNEHAHRSPSLAMILPLFSLPLPPLHNGSPGADAEASSTLRQPHHPHPWPGTPDNSSSLPTAGNILPCPSPGTTAGSASTKDSLLCPSTLPSRHGLIEEGSICAEALVGPMQKGKVSAILSKEREFTQYALATRKGKTPL